MRYILLTILCFTSLTLFGQHERHGEHKERKGDRHQKMSHEQIESLKIAYLTKKLELSPEEAQGFWPIYNEYAKKKKALRVARKERHNIQNVNDEQANELIDAMLEDKQKELDIERTYVNQFKQVLAPQKVIKLFVLERRFKEEMLRDVKRRLNEK